MAGHTDKSEGVEHGAVAPLYERLPRGPHQMGRGEVAENQRQRMLGAMVEAVASRGYGRTSVKQVVTLAGVSRRAFYEQFANKQDCFLATIDLVASRAAARVRDAYRSGEGDLGERMRVGISAFAELVAANPKSAKLALVEAPSAGAAGWLKLTRMLFAFEQMLASAFAHTPPDPAPLPTPVVRGIVGGLQRIAFTRLREGRPHELVGLVDDMLAWTLAMTPESPRRSGDHPPSWNAATALGVRARAARRTDSPPLGGDQRSAYPQPDTNSYRARVLDSALHMAALEGYENLSPLPIVDHADVSIDMFFNLFSDMDECFAQALERLSEGVHTAISDERLASAQWPLAVPGALRRLMRHFAAHPAHAHMIVMGAPEMGPSGLQLSLALADEVARQLLAGAPGGAPGPVAQEAVAGAIWHTVLCHAATRKIEKLPASSDHLAYVVLAPFLGAEQARRILTAKAAHRREPPAREMVKRLPDRVGSAAAF